MGIATIDLIPAAYREECRARRTVKWFLPIVGTLLLGIGGARLALGIERSGIEHELELLRADINSDTELQQRYAQLADVRDRLNRKVQVLDSLRGGLPAQHMFMAIDHAANGETWFRKWTFRRSGEIVDEAPQSVHAGYLLIVTPQEAGSQDRAWRLDTHMEIAGSALNHTALASFVERLAQRPEIADARILRTGSRREATREVIDFDLAVTVRASIKA